MNKVMHKHSKGFSLVELMIAMLLGLLLAAGIINLFLDQRRSFSQTEQSARMQENARFAIHLLSKELSLSGFYGGQIDLGELQSIADATSGFTEGCANQVSEPIIFVDQSSHGSGLGSGNSIPCVGTGNDVSGRSDVTSIRRVAGAPTVFEGSTVGTINNDEEYLRIVDYGADVQFLLGSVASTGGGIGAGVDWSLWEYESKTFYVNNDDELCVESMSAFGTSTENCLVDGIEALQFEFGVQSASGDTVQYKSTPTAAELERIVSVRIHLLVKTAEDKSYTDNKTYNIANMAAYTPGDNFRRRIYTTTAVLRNPVRL